MSLDPEAAVATADEPDEAVTALAEHLGEAIAELPVYERFQAAKERVEADEAAQAAISEFEQLRDEYVHARETGQATQEDLLQLQQAQEDLHEIPAMAEYLQVQNELELRLQAVNATISEPLAVDFGEKAGGCCHD